MMKKTQIVLKFIWGLAIYCDSCGAWLKRYGKRVDPQYFQVDPDAEHFCSTCERKKTAEENARIKAEKKAQKEALDKVERRRERERNKKRRQRKRKKDVPPSATPEQGDSLAITRSNN